MRSANNTTRRRGFTLVETVLAISVTSVIALCVAGMAMGLSSAQKVTDGDYQAVQTNRVVMTRLASMLRQGLLVTDETASSLMLWEHDDKTNRQINLLELTILTWDDDAQELLRRRIVFPAGWPAWLQNLLNIQIPVSTAQFDNWAMSWLLNRYGDDVVLAEGVEAFTVQVDSSAPETRMVSLTMTVARNERTVTLNRTAKLRADQTGRLITWGSFTLLE